MSAPALAPDPVTAAPVAVDRWEPAPPAAVRGTVVLLPGRGEHPGVYARFGRRLAFDGYRLLVAADLTGRPAPAVPAVSGLVAAARTESAGGPVVLAGSDTGALLALAAATAARPDALLLAGLPGGAARPDAGKTGTVGPRGRAREEAGGGVAVGWAADELSARTACPVHRGLLAADPEFRPGALLAPVAADLAAAAAAARPTVPVLAFHGLADQVAPASALRSLAERLPAVTAVAVADGRHDVFNDAAHRSVAARTVQWLEQLRAAPDDGSAAPPLLVPLTPGTGTRPTRPGENRGPAPAGTAPADPIHRQEGLPR
ncbi:alpha/beta hydrolase [Kitasatospora sp. NPDC088391]|uniref:alpha/beta hydrolase n=1 Tax=Kitasatospora sp. NPDC088391 TaxID=3364074 RepID=UPI00381C3ED5